MNEPTTHICGVTKTSIYEHESDRYFCVEINVSDIPKELLGKVLTANEIKIIVE